jgi:hypothetical protein
VKKKDPYREIYIALGFSISVIPAHIFLITVSEFIGTIIILTT